MGRHERFHITSTIRNAQQSPQGVDQEKQGDRPGVAAVEVLKPLLIDVIDDHVVAHRAPLRGDIDLSRLQGIYGEPDSEKSEAGLSNGR